MSEVVAPVIMQRQCDGGKSDMSEEEWARVLAARITDGVQIHGCGTVFQWWWGSGCCCPTCGRTWSVLFSDMKRYRAPGYGPRRQIELEDRILRNVMQRLG